jgi:CxxC-x17-CxxC domain-containing protein
MSFQDRTLTCSDCGSGFTFSVKEQEQFAQKGYTAVPGRCPACRQARRAKRELEAARIKQTNSNDNTQSTARHNQGSYGRSNSMFGQKKQMYPATCATCGKATQVPFQPRSDRPVFCSDCFRKTNTVQH